MKKIYFGGKFNLIKNKNLLLNEKLEKDYRSILLGDSNLLTLANNNVKLKNYPILYKGPFYCEQASNGDYTSNSCEVVVTEELAEILQMLMDKYTFENVDHSWTKLCYYYDYLGPEK